MMNAQTTAQVAKIRRPAKELMAERERFSFGRSFLKMMAAGLPHPDTGKVSAFLVACGVITPEALVAEAAAGNITRESLAAAAQIVIMDTPAEQLPVRFRLAA